VLETMPTVRGQISDFTRLTPQNSGTNSFGGADNRMNNMTVNGAAFNNSFGLGGQPGDRTGVAPISMEAIEQVQVSIAPYDVRQGNFVGASVDTITRSGTNSLRGSVYHRFPSRAALAGSLWLRTQERFQTDFFAGLDDPDPLTAWQRQSDTVKRLAEWIQGKEEVHIQAPGTDIKLGIAGRTFIPCVGTHNMPDGEFFTGPIEDSVNGEVAFSFPATYAGREVSGVKFKFVDGKVTDASAEQGEDFLIEMLDTDEGARTLGELGIGTNYGITTGTKEILLDEKIGGTVHMAVGMSYPESGGVNDSAIHWDMVCDLRQGGRITVDGREFQVDGRFVV